MIDRVRQLVAHVHLAPGQLALCLDCDECFKLGVQTCPACGSATSTSLSRFLEDASSWPALRRPEGSLVDWASVSPGVRETHRGAAC